MMPFEKCPICGGELMDSGRVYEPILSAEQLAGLQVSPEQPPYDGDGLHFRLLFVHCPGRPAAVPN